MGNQFGNLFKYTKEQAAELIKLARESIESEFSGKEPEIQTPGKKEFRQARGVFVTLHDFPSMQLRGCIGFPYPKLALAEAVAQAARSAAFSDPRFLPLTEKELQNIAIEISILTPHVECKPKDIEVGKDGLICGYVGYNGLLLPQVAIEHKIDRLQFIEALCEKAGLPKDAWQKKGFKLFKFQAQIFSEKSPNGEIVEVIEK